MRNAGCLPQESCSVALLHSRARAAGGFYLGGGIGQATVKDSTSAGNFDADNAA